MRIIATVVTLALILPMTVGAVSREKDPVWQQLTEIDGRVLRIERLLNNESLMDMAQRDDQLQQQLRQLRGQVEELQHSVDVSRNQFRDAIADLDKRVQALENNKAAAPADSAATTSGAAAGTSTISDKDAYQAAFGMLKDGKYAEAISALTAFINTYPQSSLLDNAQYWIGEAHYFNRNYQQALSAFQTVLAKYPGSAKAPDAMLKLGYTQYELKDFKAARAALNKLISQYPDSKSATLAQQRIAKMNAEGQ